MKKIFALALLTLSAFSVQAQRDPVYAIQSLTVPSVTTGSTSNSIGAVIDCRKQQNVALSWHIGGASPAILAGTNLTANLSASVDGTVYQTNAFTLLLNLSTTPQNVLVTNLNVKGFGYVRLDSITATGFAATNTVKYAIKINAP